jgi:tetratricopeptide (TPR) repeat protein
MTCLSTDTIVRYLEGGLDADERRAADEHIDSCGACHEVVAAAGGADEDDADMRGAPLLKGDELSHFVILGWLGRGGMGVVYEAFDRSLDRRVALKMLRPDMTGRTQLLDEAKLAARVRSPHAIVIYEVGSHGDDVFVALELVSGPNLREYARRASHDELWGALRQAGVGLEHVHDAGVVHGDVKPENVLVDKLGAKISDFGLGHAQVRLTAQDGIEETSPTLASRGGGTPRYAAPEQASGGASALADQWSFAAVAWELLTGRHPFLSDGHSGPVALRSALEPSGGTSLEPGVRSALRRALAWSPAERFPDMAALNQALAPHVIPPSVPREPRWLWGGLGVLMTALVVAVLARVPPPNPCQNLDYPLRVVWSRERSVQIGAALERLGVPYALGLWRQAAQLLDGLSAAWSREREEVCRATALRGEVPQPVAQARVACLQELLDDWDTQLQAISRSTAADLDELNRAVAQLPQPVSCRRVTTLRGSSEGLQKRLLELRAMRRAVHVKDTLAGALALQKEPGFERSLELQAEVVGLEGWALSRSGGAQAVKRLQDALALAERARHLELRAVVLVDLLFAYQQSGKYAELPVLEGVTRAAVEQATAQPLLTADLEWSLGRAAARQGKHRAALALFERALAEMLRALPDPDVLAVPIRLSIGVELGYNGRWSDALAATEREIQDLRQRHPDHPLLIAAHINLVSALVMVHRNDEALTRANDALASNVAARVPEAQRAVLLTNRALALIELGRATEALADLAVAREIHARTRGEKSLRAAQVDMTEARAQTKLGDLGHAEVAARAAEALVAESPMRDTTHHAEARVVLGEVLLAKGDGGGARAAALAAWQYYASNREDASKDEVAKGAWLLARVYGPQHAEGRKLAQEALAIHRSHPYAAGDAADVEAWLAGARPGR